jgi:hypothetical protein
MATDPPDMKSELESERREALRRMELAEAADTVARYRHFVEVYGLANKRPVPRARALPGIGDGAIQIERIECH